MNFLSLLDHSVGLVLKGLRALFHNDPSIRRDCKKDMVSHHRLLKSKCYDMLTHFQPVILIPPDKKMMILGGIEVN